jgi:hypothetical protein
MILRKVFFMLCVSTGVSANLRAPVRIDRAGTELKAEKAALKVLSETLEFQCPEAYTGKMDFDLFAARACDARVRYQISAAATERVKLTFVFSGTGKVSFRYRDKVLTAEPQSQKIGDRRFCSFCPDSMKNLQVAEQVMEFEKGNVARSGFLGIGYKNDTMGCVIEENEKYADIPLAIAPVKEERRSTTAEIRLAKKPQRLRCSYSSN